MSLTKLDKVMLGQGYSKAESDKYFTRYEKSLSPTTPAEIDRILIVHNIGVNYLSFSYRTNAGDVYLSMEHGIDKKKPIEIAELIVSVEEKLRLCREALNGRRMGVLEIQNRCHYTLPAGEQVLIRVNNVQVRITHEPNAAIVDYDPVGYEGDSDELGGGSCTFHEAQKIIDKLKHPESFEMYSCINVKDLYGIAVDGTFEDLLAKIAKERILANCRPSDDPEDWVVNHRKFGFDDKGFNHVVWLTLAPKEEDEE